MAQINLYLQILTWLILARGYFSNLRRKYYDCLIWTNGKFDLLLVSDVQNLNPKSFGYQFTLEQVPFGVNIKKQDYTLMRISQKTPKGLDNDINFYALFYLSYRVPRLY